MDEDASKYPDCVLCHDHGLVGGKDLSFQYDFCKCKAGQEREMREPHAVAEANDNLKKLYGK